MTQDDLRATLKDWAEYYIDPSKGYAQSTTLYRAMKGQFMENSNFLSTIPNGVESPERTIKDLEHRMRVVEEAGWVAEIQAVKEFYKAWAHNQTWKTAAEILQASRTTFFRWKDRGERELLNSYRIR